MNNKIKSAAVISAATLAVILIASPVDAQDAGQDDENRLVLEEITVTARKKSESVQDVPMAITAFGADQIEAAGISSLDDVAAFTPGLTFSNLYGEFLAVPVIRGIAPTAIFRENNTAVFIDGVFVSGREGLNASQLDLERIEVLKGPQSTRYGRNAFAGAINYVSARPTEEFEGKAEFKVGNDEKRAARLSLSGPLISDVLLGRVAAQIDEWSGSYDNNLSQTDVGGYQYKNMQAGLWYTPSDNLDMRWVVYVTDDRIDNSALHSLAHNCEDRMDLPDIEDPDNPGQIITNPEATGTPRPQNYCGTIPKLAKKGSIGISESAVGEERELLRSSLHIEWAPGFGTITALTGFSTTKQSALTDGARDPGYLPYVYLGINGDNSFLAEQLEVSPGDEVKEISQELRFSSAQDGAFRYNFGAYWYTVKAEARATDVFARVSGANGARLPDDWDFVAGGFYPAPGVIGDAIFMPWFSQTIDEIDTAIFATDETDSWSVFGGLEFDLGDRWSFDLGVRYTNDDKTVDEASGTSAKDSWDYWTGRAGAKFQLTEDVMIYSSIGNGKKSGGFDIIEVDLLPPGSPPIEDVVRVFTYDIEENTTYELGSKGTLWEGRAQYDLAMFYTDWTDILIPQVTEVDPETGWPLDQPTGVDQTGGDATVIGIEASLNVLLSEYWTITLGGSWTDSEFDDADLASYRRLPSFWEDTDGDGIGDQGDISGKKVLRQSEWQGNFTADYRRPAYQDWDWYTRGDVLYQSSQWIGAANQAKIPGRTVLNLRMGLDSDHYQLEFWVLNLLDDDKPVAAFRDVFFGNTHTGVGKGTTDDLFPFRMTVRYPNLRTFGLTGRIRF